MIDVVVVVAYGRQRRCIQGHHRASIDVAKTVVIYAYSVSYRAVSRSYIHSSVCL